MESQLLSLTLGVWIALGAQAPSSGPVLPATCAVGVSFYLTSGINGFYTCAPANTWNLYNAGTMLTAYAYGCVGDGTTNNDACLSAALTALNAAGGGTLYFPPGTYRVNSQILLPNNGGSPQPDQSNIRITGAGGGAAWYGLNSSVLDLRYTAGDGNAKIETRGRGTLMIDRLTIKDGGTTNATPFVHSTNTVLVIEAASFIGSGNVGQDAIVLGGTATAVGSGVTAPFQGYGTRIVGNHFRNLNRGIYGLNFANAVLFSANSFQGNVGTIAIEFDGSNGGGQPDYGNQITHNVIEMDAYQYAVKFTRAKENELIGNQMHDPGVNVLAYYRFLDLSTQNRIVCGTSPVSKTFMSGEAASIAATTIVCAENLMLESSGNGYAASQMSYGLSVVGSYDSSKNWPGPLTVSDQFTPRERVSIGFDHANTRGVLDVSTAVATVPLWIPGSIMAGVRSTDPGCTTTAQVGKLWFDTTTTTTVYKVCMNVAGTVQWVTK